MASSSGASSSQPDPNFLKSLRDMTANDLRILAKILQVSNMPEKFKNKTELTAPIRSTS